MINMNVSHQWLLAKTLEEDGVILSVGGWVSDLKREFGPNLGDDDSGRPGLEPPVLIREKQPATAAQPMLMVFGQFVNMSRRERSITLNQLAKDIDIDPLDLRLIEDGKKAPEPRIVSRIARVFNVSPKRLMQLAGYVENLDREVADAVYAFAARSNTKPLEPEERDALHEFVRALTTE